MKQALKIIAIGFYALVALAAIFFAVPQTGWKALSVQTGSMTPIIPKGSLVIIHATPLSQIAVGQVVTYREPSRPSVTITHRVVAKGEKGGIPVFTTKGDANKVADAQIPGGSIVGTVQLHVAGLGKVVNWLRTPLGIILLVGLPGLLVIISEFQLMIGRLQDYAREEAEAKAMRTAARPLAAPLRPSAAIPVRRPRPRVPIIRIAAAVVMLPALALGVRGTLSQLTSSVSITGNRLGVAATGTTTGGGGTSTTSCPSGTSSISITNTGPGSTNSVTSTSTCTISSSSNTSVTVTNTSNQTATTGNASTSGNTTGNGTTTSGSATNSADSQTNISTP